MSDQATVSTGANAADSGNDSSALPAGHSAEPTAEETRSALYSEPGFMEALMDADHIGHASALRRRAQLFAAEPAAHTVNGEPSEPSEKQIGSPADEGGAKPEFEVDGAPSAPEFYGDLQDVTAYAGQETNPELVAEAREIAHGLDMPQAMLNTLALRWNMAAKGLEAGTPIDYEGTREAAEVDLIREWGEDGYAEKVGRTKRLVAMAGPRFAEMLFVSGLGNDPTVIRILARHAERLEARGRLK